MGDEPERNKIIGDEECYFANIEFIVNGMPRVDQVYMGSKTLNVYSYDGEFKIRYLVLYKYIILNIVLKISYKIVYYVIITINMKIIVEI